VERGVTVLLGKREGGEKGAGGGLDRGGVALGKTVFVTDGTRLRRNCGEGGGVELWRGISKKKGLVRS